ncbi:MAG: cupin domain-containing protein [Candidatus Heimdallarchaeota archaeon]|nr:cupin domain-containing protein [Candidatus Heimdallarchaeota archaeon]MDH5645891.1 cupin domain-containing protein [Candidatus Heimdallarchaeota archaeon]
MENQVIDTNKQPWIDLPNGMSKILVDKKIGKNSTLRLFKLKPSDIFETHEHNFIQFMYFIKGIGKISIDEQIYDIKSGLSVFILPFQCHSLENTGNTDLELLIYEAYESISDNTPFIDF